MLLKKNNNSLFVFDPLFVVFGVFLISLLVCACSSENDESSAPTVTEADLSVTSEETLIPWTTANDLTQQLNAALVYDYGVASESEVDTPISFALDSTFVIVSINFKTAYQNQYNDSNPSNNSVTIALEKEPIESNAIILSADGPGDTYALITSVLAPGYNPIETPDCNHQEFGDHIDEVFDSTLNSNVFRFFIHTTPDNDRCINFDRQRNEIKTYDNSPDNLLGVENETVVYKWKFKLTDGFQSSPKFTHIHQLKSVGGAYSSMPMYTLTTRKGTPDQLELRYAETDTQVTLTQTDLSPFIGEWLEVNETISYGSNGSYSITIERIIDQSPLMQYSTNNIVNWRPAGEFVRPKWGIYRSLVFADDLRDEVLLFNDFSIEEL